MPHQLPNAASYRKAKKSEILERRAKIAELYKQGFSQRQIAEQVGVVASVVNENIKSIFTDLRESTKRDMAAFIAIELEKVNLRERQCEAAYEASRKPKRIAVAAQRDGAEGLSTMSSATVVERDEGDPRFLAEKAKCVEQRVKLLRMLAGVDENETKEKKSVTTLAELIAAYDAPKALPAANPDKGQS